MHTCSPYKGVVGSAVPPPIRTAARVHCSRKLGTMPDEALWDRENDTRPWQETQAQQIAAMPALLDRLSGQGEAWRQRFDGVKLPATPTLEDLRAVPFTTKQNLREAQANFTPSRPLGDFQGVETAELAQITGSTGTTGEPVFFSVTEADRQRWNHSIANGYFTAGVRKESIVALTTGMPMVAGGMPYADGIRTAGGTLVWVGGQSIPRMATILDRLSVDVLVGTASFSAFFAARCEETLGKSAREMAIRTVISGGEPGLGVPEIRAKVTDAWGATRLSEVMGMGDVLPMLWAECSMGQGMHFTAGPGILVELIDPDTGEHVPWEPGARGEAVYTTLTREACPVVRYRSRDHLLVTGVDCACGRTAPTMRCIGRTDDMLIYKAMNVFPSAIREVALRVGRGRLTGAMRIRKETREQVRFDSPIPLEVEIAASVGPAEREALVAEIGDSVRADLIVRVDVEPLEPGAIPFTSDKNGLTYTR
ncbi:MAG: coenzyme synthetase [Naasia sp.]|nr:coenzyme synthetase [Naasia sp.]